MFFTDNVETFIKNLYVVEDCGQRRLGQKQFLHWCRVANCDHFTGAYRLLAWYCRLSVCLSFLL